MTDEDKVINGRNSRKSQQIRSCESSATLINITEKTEPLIKTAEEKLQDVAGNLLRSPDIEPSTYQVDIVEDTTTTAAPPADAAAADAPAADATPGEPAAGSADDTSAPPVPSEDQPPTENAPEDGPTSSNTEDTMAPEKEMKEETPADEKMDKEDNSADEKEAMQEGEKDEKSASEEKPSEGAEDKPSETGTGTEQTTTEQPNKDPYRIEIPLEKKINKRTQRKLWEEIEKRKPLIPKYVERHIQKYAKPPFELWGCKFRGKGSCYGCGG